MQTTVATKTGIVSIAIGGITASFGSADLREWLEIVSDYGPMLLSIMLFFIIYKMEKKHANCESEQKELWGKLHSLRKELWQVKSKCYGCSNERSLRNISDSRD